jgi:hypothetical protein
MKIDFLGISQRGCCVVRVEYTNIQFYAATLSQVFPRKFIDNRAYNLATASVRLWMLHNASITLFNIIS